MCLLDKTNTPHVTISETYTKHNEIWNHDLLCRHMSNCHPIATIFHVKLNKISAPSFPYSIVFPELTQLDFSAWVAD